MFLFALTIPQNIFIFYTSSVYEYAHISIVKYFIYDIAQHKPLIKEKKEDHNNTNYEGSAI